MKLLFALIVSSFAAFAPMHAYAWGETCSNDANDSGINLNVQVCGNDIL